MCQCKCVAVKSKITYEKLSWTKQVVNESLNSLEAYRKAMMNRLCVTSNQKAVSII